jgi:Phasin protein
MSTTQRDKPTAKQRQRNRKAEQRNQKSEQHAAPRPDQESPDQHQQSPLVAPPIVAAAEAEPAAIEPAAIESVSTEPVAIMAAEEAPEVALSGEVLPPDIRDTTSPLNMVSLQTVAQAYGDYTRKSWQTSRFLAERLVTVRSLDEAIEIQGEFAKQVYANFFAQSQKMCELYGELAIQFFKPLDKFATGWTHIGR